MVIGKIIRVGTKAVKEVIKASKPKQPSHIENNKRKHIHKSVVEYEKSNLKTWGDVIPPSQMDDPVRIADALEFDRARRGVGEFFTGGGGSSYKGTHAMVRISGAVKKTNLGIQTNKQITPRLKPDGFFLALGSRKRGTDKAWAVVREGGKTSLKKYKGGKTTTYSGIKLKRPTANQSLGLGFGGIGVAGLAVQDWDKARDNLPFLLSKKKDKPKKKGKKE